MTTKDLTISRVFRLWCEFILIFVGLPVAVYTVRERSFMFAVLWIGALMSLHVLRRNVPAFSYRREWNIEGAKAGLQPMLRRFFAFAAMITLFTFVHDGDRLLSFPLERPALWFTVMLLYPLLSVWPQEILFRSLIMQRYATIFTAPGHLMMASAFAFGFAHITFDNWIAILFTFLGGWLFSDTYMKSRSLALVCLEHALYGCFVFTIGLGWYFYAAAWH